MLAKVLVICSAWFLLSLIVGLLMGSVISTFREAPAPGFSLSLETDAETALLNELEGDETLVLAHAQMQGVR